MSILKKHDFIIKYYPFKLFNIEDKFFYVSGVNSAIFEINSKIAKLLDYDNFKFEDVINIFKDNWSEDELLDVFNEMEKKLMIRTELNIDKLNEKLDYYKGIEKNISSITLLILQDCNLRCSYCYADGGEYNNKGVMSLKTAQNAIDYLFKNSNNRKKVNITFFGGEPLIEFFKIKKLVEYSKQLAKKYEKEVNFSITTNGILLNEEINSFLIDNKFSITLSIDGNEEVTNFNRYNINNIGAYKSIIEKSNKLRKTYKVTARSTITSKGLDYNENFEHLSDLNFSNVHMSIALNMVKNNDIEKIIKTYKLLIDNYMNYLKEHNYKKLRKMGNINALMYRIHDGGIRYKNCGAINNMIAIDINGEIFPCHRFVSKKEYSIGNIYDGVNEEKYKYFYKGMLLSNNENCSECWAKNICGGGCSFENVQSNNRLNKPNSNYCKIMKEVIEYLIVAYLSMNEYEKERLLKY